MNELHVVDNARLDLGGNMRGGDIHTFSPKLWRFLIERYAVRSMLDVGCGEGHAVAFFHALSVVAHGIDGLDINIKRAVFPIAQHDLLDRPYIMPVDLVWSCEVAEHILEDRVDCYTKTLANGRVVAMTHALPGQGGHHHVNLQTAEYWIHKMQQLGYFLDPTYGIGREIAATEGHMTYFSTSGLIFVKI